MKYEPDIDLTRKLQSQVDKLERMADAIGHTPVRHAVNERIVEIRLFLRDGNLSKLRTTNLLKLEPRPNPCGRPLAKDQYWTVCGETDMGQTAPAKCTECGGNYLLA